MIIDTSPPIGGMKYGIKLRLYPTSKQRKYLDHTFNATRRVWNVLLDRHIKSYKAYESNTTLPKPGVSSFDFVNRATNLKHEEDLRWLGDIPAVAITQKALDLGSAFKNFFDKNKSSKSGYPQFKKRNCRQSFRLTKDNFSIKDNRLKLPKISSIKIRWSRYLTSEPSQVTVSRTPSGEYYASFLCLKTPEPTNGHGVIGIDLGVKTLCTLSDGTVIDNPKRYMKLQHLLRRYQRQLSKMTKGSKRRDRHKQKIAKVYQRISRFTKDFVHKITTHLVNTYKTIVIEDLNVSGMLHNHKLARHIAGSIFGEIRRQLTYKVIWSSWCTLVIADRWEPSTQLCSECKLRPSKKLDLSVQQWTCEHCGTHHGRDENASKNIESIAYRDSIAAIIDRNPGGIVLAERYSIY